MKNPLVVALKAFIEKYHEASQEHPDMFRIEYDQDWPSDCYQTIAEQGEWVDWRPISRHLNGPFSDLEKALEISIHPDIVSYYSAYWSDNLDAKTDKGSLQLLQAWNQQDFERLQQNLVGHVLMKRRLNQPETLFFALTDEEDFILTVDNKSGEVLLEQVGLLPQEVLAPNLCTFLQSLTPAFVHN